MQIADTYPDPCWRYCLLVVTEDKGWGVMGYVSIPAERDQGAGLAFLRVRDAFYVVVGTAEWMRAEE